MDTEYLDNDTREGLTITRLAELPARAIIDKTALAGILSCEPRTITNLVARGEIPPPVTLCKRSVWTPGAILDHLERRLESALDEAIRHPMRRGA